MTLRRIVTIMVVAIALAALAVCWIERRAAASEIDCDPRNDLCAAGCP